jgi:hypothetical protein
VIPVISALRAMPSPPPRVTLPLRLARRRGKGNSAAGQPIPQARRASRICTVSVSTSSASVFM